MEPKIRSLVDISKTDAAIASSVDRVLDNAIWASSAFRCFDAQTVQRIVESVAQAAADNAEKYAEWAVEESGFGNAKHKAEKNRVASQGVIDTYMEDFASPRILEAEKIVELPQPAGVVFGLVPSTNPIATVYFKLLLCLMTRNTIVFSPHPAVRQCSIDAIKFLARVAEDAGAPAGTIQVIERPNIPLIEAFMSSPKTDLILATGGGAMVRAAYSSSNPAIGVGPGNAPVFVDCSADIAQAARHIVESKTFDNSVLCTNESVIVSQSEIGTELTRELTAAGGYICNAEETSKLRAYLFSAGSFNVKALGKEAQWIAEQAGFNIGTAQVLVAPVEKVGREEILSKEKLCPVIAWLETDSRSVALESSRAVLRLSGAGHSAAIHAEDQSVIYSYASMVEAYRVVVNAPCSTGAAGFVTGLAPTFTIGTGFWGRSSLGENLQPKHLVHWKRIAHHNDSPLNMNEYRGMDVRADHTSAAATPRYRQTEVGTKAATSGHTAVHPQLREELRELISKELKSLIGRQN